MNARRTAWLCLAMGLAAAVYLKAADQEPARPAAPTGPPNAITAQSPSGSMLDGYCVACHNSRARTGGLSVEELDLANVGKDAQTWEKVVTKLRLGAMPPPGAKRPDPATYKAFIDQVESALDQAAAAAPNPGRPLTRRLTRVEYTNAVRDLLAFEFDGASLLPADNVGHGFDNIGEVLSVSPLLMERYMFAAERISRLAVGEAAPKPAAETYRVSHKYMQTDRASEDLPFGTRGGLAVRHVFPADGEYSIKIRLQRNDDGYIRGLREQHQLDVRLDGTRVKQLVIGGETRGKSGPIWTGNQNVEYSGEPAQVSYEFTADDALQTRFAAKAGQHLLAVAFVKQRTQPVGVKMPPIAFDDLLHYKGGEPAVELVTIEGPYTPTGVGETASRARIFACIPTAAAEEEPCASKILATLARRAYRRPVEPEELNDLLQLYRTGRSSGNFERGIHVALQGILAGPEFLFRIEEDPGDASAESAYRIGDIDLASRLSFFLWSTIPDEELLTLAEQRKLSEPATLEQQVRRMLRDPRAHALVGNFAAQWLSLRNLAAADPDENIFPDFDDELKDALRQETELLVASAIREDRSIVDLLTADHTFVNERLARHYGIPNVFGSRFRPVQLTDETRRGILGHGSILMVTSYNGRTSPVLRGKWVLEQLLDMPPPPPPPNVPALEEKAKDGRTFTGREALEEHRKNPVCASCHKLMDPIGFALENFDAVGGYRTTEGRARTPIDASGVLFDGTKFTGATEFRKVLVTHKERFVNTAAKKLLTYAIGRPLEYYDNPEVRRIVRAAAPGNYRWSSLILGVVKSAPFQMRRVVPS